MWGGFLPPPAVIAAEGVDTIPRDAPGRAGVGGESRHSGGWVGNAGEPGRFRETLTENEYENGTRRNENHAEGRVGGGR